MTPESAEPRACRLCGASQVQSVGSIADSDYFAGRVLDEPIAGRWLWRCESCESLFRHPILSTSTYLQLYEAGAPEQWQADAPRRDLQLIRSIIALRPLTRDVLDVGCGSGDFLLSLPAAIGKSGIEPSVAAAGRAASRGIAIAAESLERLPAEARFDVITFIDVVEHLPEPGQLLRTAMSHLHPGGIIIVSTGDPQSAAWRFFGSRFWYSSFPEHVSFPSGKFLERWQAENGGGGFEKLATRYRHLPRSLAALYWIIQLGYCVSPALFHRVGRVAGLLGRLKPKRRYFSPAVPGLFVDHQVVTLRGPAVARENRKSA